LIRSVLENQAKAKSADATLLQPLRRTFYTPYDTLQYYQLPTKSTSTIDEAAPMVHEHELERTAHSDLAEWAMTGVSWSENKS
jgi:hypothetical protein